MLSDFQGNTARKWLSRGLNLNFNLSCFLQPMSHKVIYLLAKNTKTKKTSNLRMLSVGG